jgi:hypothetical protein
MLSFDESHVLATSLTQNYNNTSTQYDILCSSLNDFLEYLLFTIFLSTHSSLGLLAPPQQLAISARIHSGMSHLQTPITEAPFDCFATSLDTSKLTLNDLWDIKFMVKFGRPL